MKKIFLLLVILLFLLVGCNYVAKDTQEVSENINIQIERIDYSIKSDSGKILAYIYYDKPIVKNIKFSDKINSFYEKEMEGWFNGSNRLTHNQEGNLEKFKDTLSEHRENEYFGDDIIAKQPFLYTVNSDVMMMDKNHLSIRQITTVQTAGKRMYYYFGSTFDLQTGELVSLDKLIDINANEFRNTLADFLSENLLQYNHNLTAKELINIYGANNKGDYLINFNYFNTTVNLNYEYYYDGDNFYVILNYSTLLDQGIIMKWNGKLREDFKAQLICYKRDNQGNYKLIEY